MKLFLDTANIASIRAAYDYGVISGVTTNPTSIAKEGIDLKRVIGGIADIVDGAVYGEVISTQHEKMVEEAHELVKISPKVEITIPMGGEGLKALRILKSEGIRTNCTLIFTASQALLAARAGASFVSPFIGQLEDSGISGINLIADIVEIFTTHALDCKIIASSIRGPLHVTDCAKAGAHIAAIPPEILEQMIAHPLTTAGLDSFCKDWEQHLATL